MDGVPNQVCQKADRVLVVGGGCVDDNALGCCVIMPRSGIQRLARRAVDDFPPAGDVVVVVDLHQLAADARHQGDGQRTVRSGIERGHNVALLRFIGVCLSPGVVLAGGVVGGVDLGAGVLQLLRELGAVAVADGIRAPALEQVKGFGYCVHIGGNRYTTFGIHFLFSSMGCICNDQGDAFNQHISDIIKSFGVFRVFPNVKRINKKKIADEKSDVLGDIDVLIIDEKKHRIVVAEVKNFDFSKNPYEIQAEYQKMFVDGKKKSFATKHFSVMFLSLSTAFYTNTICTVNFSLFTI